MTSGTDTLADFTGGAGDDTFNAGLFFNAGTGTNLETLQNADSIAGGLGDDVLNYSYNSAAATIQPSAVSGIETINISHTGTGGLILSAANITGVTTVNSLSAANTLTLNGGWEALTTVGISNTSSAHAYTTTTAATAGTADTLTINVSGLGTAATHTFTSGAANGYETIVVGSTGDAANLITDIVVGTGTTHTTFNVTGTQDLRFTNVIDNSITTVGAGDFTGGLRLLLGNSTVTVTTGTGDDRITFGGGEFVHTAGTTLDTVNMGDGTADELRVDSADAQAVTTTSNATSLSNIEQLGVTNAIVGTIDTTQWGVTFDTFNAINGFGNNTSLTVASGTNVTATGTDSTDNARSFIVTGSATTDSMTLTLTDHDFITAANTFTSIETLNIVSNLTAAGAAADGAANVFGGATTMGTTAAQELIVVTGTEALTFTGAVTADKIDASTFAHDLVMAANTVAAGGVTIDSFTGADTLFGSTAADILNSGDGDDSVRGEDGVDIINLGAGDDTLDWGDKGNGAEMLDSGERDGVTGFTASGTAFVAGNGVDRIQLGDVLTGIDISGGGTAANFNVQTAAGNSTQTTAHGFLELSFEFSSGVDLNAGTAAALAGTTLLSALGAATGTTAGTLTVGTASDDAIIVAYQSGRAFVYGTNNDANTAVLAAEIGLLGTFEGVAVGGFDFSQFI